MLIQFVSSLKPTSELYVKSVECHINLLEKLNFYEVKQLVLCYHNNDIASLSSFCTAGVSSFLCGMPGNERNSFMLTSERFRLFSSLRLEVPFDQVTTTCFM